ncbi:MAG: type II toxin-antitoxin system Phd/YefM family antitoxin [Planctomycetota bacterium]|jgi:antitoxin (DNA-binding transcriptional repressor) of toxin-antitoxin stability system|nr:type II toxin-antitoxin system Phd/YefM family antitoxin [Planctomycetota bacterium]
MIVNVAEFKNGIDRYLELVGEEEIVITKDGKYFAKITPASESFAEYLVSLRGILPPTVTVEEAHEERIAKHERHY